MCETKLTGQSEVSSGQGSFANINDHTDLLVLREDSHSVIDPNEQCRLIDEMARLDRLNLVGEMAASIGHEVRNPMTTVRGFLQMLRGKKELANFAPHFDLMVDELDRANSIITEFLSMAKNKPGKQIQGKLDNVIEVLLPMLDAESLMSGKAVLFKGGPVPAILMFERDIRQLLLNLVRNALDVTPQGEQVQICTYVDADRVILSVSDQGPGIPPEVREKMGTAFFTTKEKGTGIGLAVCRHVAERHNAQLYFRTGPQGTTFYVSFPIAETPAETEAD